MLKQGFLTTVVSMLLALSPAMADKHMEEHKGAEHPAHEMGEAALSDSDKTEQLSEEYRDNLGEAKDTKNPPHPAHKMGSENTHKGSEHPAHEMGEAKKSAAEDKKQLKQDYKDNLEAAKEAANAPHPAHEMGGKDVLDE